MSNSAAIPQQAIDVTRSSVAREALTKVPANIARRFGILPIAVNESTLQVVLADPSETSGVSQIEARTGLSVQILPCKNPEAIPKAISRCYPRVTEADGTPLSRLQGIVFRALQLRSSDIHLDPQETKGCVRMRIDGVMRTDSELPPGEFTEIVSAIKVAASLDIADKRSPQDGQLSFEEGVDKISIRIATIPTIYGEKITMRLLASSDSMETLGSLEGLGMCELHHRMLLEALGFSHGLILLSGPTGSGKTTTLYAALRHLREPGTHHIISIEDPVEIRVDGITQVHIDSERVSFNGALRSTLRHDPDVIMIGEIRDAETADIAIKSALTGHLVLSTLHANDAASVITRLLNLGVSPELVASALRLVIAQRLVRRPCPYCMQWETVDGSQYPGFGWSGPVKVPVPSGCPLCGGSGYSGRIGIYEMAPVKRVLREMILDKAGHDALSAELFGKRRLPSLAVDGASKIAAGMTTPAEVLKATYLGEVKV